MSDSDSDYCDVGADDFEIRMADNYEVDKTKQTGGKSRGARGKDINWLPIFNFEEVEDYDNSKLFKLLKTKFTLQRSRDPDYADTETYICVLNEASPTVSPNISINGLLSFMLVRSSSETLMTPNSFRMVIVL